MARSIHFPYALAGMSLLVAFILNILPLPVWSQWFRPEWVVLVVLYWVIAFPEVVGIGFAWTMGLILDGLNGTVLGEHALALLLVAFLAYAWFRQIKSFPLWQTTLLILLLIFFYKLVIWLVQGMTGQFFFSGAYGYSILTSALLWPWVDAVLTVKQSKTRLRAT